MHLIEARNVHAALPVGIRQLLSEGYQQESRNGPVVVFPYPAATVYQYPCERVIFHEKRNANPFFHLYEALWMLAGKRDVKSVAHYVKRMADYSDDGKNFHGAYGYRWRHHFKVDQVSEAIKALNNNPLDRRVVIQMWDSRVDLGKEGKDFPCNTQLTLRINPRGQLDMMVSNRSNDMIMGAYGANAVHFSFLQEYIAMAIGKPVGRYWQVSANLHAYKVDLDPLIGLGFDASTSHNPYHCEARPLPLSPEGQAAFDLDLAVYMSRGPIVGFSTAFFRQVVTPMHHAHEAWKAVSDEKWGFEHTVEILNQMPTGNDWKKAALEWVGRRKKAHHA